MTDQHWERGQFGGFWLRVAAVLVDAAIALAVFAVLVLLTPPVLDTLLGDASTEVLIGLVAGLLVVGGLLYDVLMTAGIGGTLGKRAAGIEVRGADGDRIEVGRALGRSVARLLSVAPVALGLLWAGWDGRKQCWHDKLARTVVVKRRHLPVTLRYPDALWWAAGPPALPAGTPAAPAEEAPTSAPAATGAGTAAGSATAGTATAPQTSWGMPASAPAADTPGGDAEPVEQEPASALDDEPVADTPTAPLGGEAEEDPHDALAAASGVVDDEPPPSALDSFETPDPAASPQASAFRELFGDEPAAPGTAEGAGSSAASEVQPEGSDEGSEPVAAPDAQPSAPAHAGEGPAHDSDPNLVAIERADVAADAASWLQQVAAQVDPRLDQVSATWRQQEQAAAARACAFGLLLGHLATLYPHMSDELHAVAEAHPSFSTLLAGNRLATLQQISGDRSRMAAWLGPLIGVDDAERVARLLQ